jgi:hypothetical protein
MTSKELLAHVEPRVSNPDRGLLVVPCKKLCRFSVSREPAHGETWQWSGSAEAPSISPSINCHGCGQHFTVTDGVMHGADPDYFTFDNGPAA